MADLLIRDVPDEVVAAIDLRAARLGLSRTEYLRRQLTRGVTDGEHGMTVEDFRRFSGSFADLDDDSVMRAAWH